jgi:hypothetical protein
MYLETGLSLGLVMLKNSEFCHLSNQNMMQTEVETFSVETKLLVDYEGVWSSNSTPDGQTATIDEGLISRVSRSLLQASDYALDLRKLDGHWCGELKSNTTLTSEEVFFKQSLGLDQKVDGEKYQRYLLSEQNTDGSWGIAPKYPGDVSTSAEAYLALKILGLQESAPEMSKARDFILQAGGIAKVRIFARKYCFLVIRLPILCCLGIVRRCSSLVYSRRMKHPLALSANKTRPGLKRMEIIHFPTPKSSLKRTTNISMRLLRIVIAMLPTSI